MVSGIPFLDIYRPKTPNISKEIFFEKKLHAGLYEKMKKKQIFLFIDKINYYRIIFSYKKFFHNKGDRIIFHVRIIGQQSGEPKTTGKVTCRRAMTTYNPLHTIYHPLHTMKHSGYDW